MKISTQIPEARIAMASRIPTQERRILNWKFSRIKKKRGKKTGKENTKSWYVLAMLNPFHFPCFLFRNNLIVGGSDESQVHVRDWQSIVLIGPDPFTILEKLDAVENPWDYPLVITMCR